MILPEDLFKKRCPPVCDNCESDAVFLYVRTRQPTIQLCATHFLQLASIVRNDSRRLSLENMPRLLSEEHKNYLKSPRWKKISRDVLSRDGGNCRLCFKKAKDVHHVDYRYKETLEETEYCISVCRDCHKRVHGK